MVVLDRIYRMNRITSLARFSQTTSCFLILFIEWILSRTFREVQAVGLLAGRIVGRNEKPNLGSVATPARQVGMSFAVLLHERTEVAKESFP